MQRSKIIEPMSPEQHHNYLSWMRTTLLASCILLAILGCITSYYGWQWYQLRQELKHVDQQLNDAQPALAEFETMNKAIQEIDVKQRKVSHIKQKMNLPLSYIQEVSNYCSDVIALQQFELKDKQIIVHLESSSMRMVLKMVEQLQSSSSFTQVEITSLKQLDEQRIHVCIHAVVK